MSRALLFVRYQVHTLTTIIHQKHKFSKFNFLSTPTFKKPVFSPVYHNSSSLKYPARLEGIKSGRNIK